jgi:hypothetical protein
MMAVVAVEESQKQAHVEERTHSFTLEKSGVF